MGLLSTSVQSLGLTLQRKSHLLEDDKESYEVRRPPYKRRRWQVGLIPRSQTTADDSAWDGHVHSLQYRWEHDPNHHLAVASAFNPPSGMSMALLES